MTISKSLSIVGIATLPLAALTAAAFFSSGERGGTPGEVPTVPARVVEVREKAATELQAKAGVETAAGTDPAGFRAKADGAAAKEPPYSWASVLAEAGAAANAEDLERTGRALASLADGSAFPVSLQANVTERKQRLERHATWLKNRTLASDALRLAAETMHAPASIPNATKAADTVDELRRRLPKVAKADAAADEPGDALTEDEAAEASRLRQWASYRTDFLSLKAKHATLGSSRPDALKELVAGWDRFLATNDRPGAPDLDACLADARRLRTESRLSFLWATAVAQDAPDALAPAVLAWLDEPVADAGDGDRRGQATTLLKTWLERHLPPPPQPPGGLAGAPDMQEGIVDAGEVGKRLIAIFQAVPGQPRRYRWWYTAAERKELPLGKDSGFLKGPPTPPKCIGWASRYRELRDAYLARFAADDGNFSTECLALADACRAHMQTPALDPANDVTAPVSSWEKLFADAADRATAFQRACHDSGLGERIGAQVR